jgi:hypothetical protein
MLRIPSEMFATITVVICLLQEDTWIVGYVNVRLSKLLSLCSSDWDQHEDNQS